MGGTLQDPPSDVFIMSPRVLSTSIGQLRKVLVEDGSSGTGAPENALRQLHQRVTQAPADDAGLSKRIRRSRSMTAAKPSIRSTRRLHVRVLDTS